MHAKILWIRCSPKLEPGVAHDQWGKQESKGRLDWSSIIGVRKVGVQDSPCNAGPWGVKSPGQAGQLWRGSWRSVNWRSVNRSVPWWQCSPRSHRRSSWSRAPRPPTWPPPPADPTPGRTPQTGPVASRGIRSSRYPSVDIKNNAYIFTSMGTKKYPPISNIINK